MKSGSGKVNIIINMEIEAMSTDEVFQRNDKTEKEKEARTELHEVEEDHSKIT